MKKLTAIVVILALLLLGAYYGTGLITERTLKQNIEVVNQAKGIFVDIAQYKRGWFVSAAKLRVKITIPEQIERDVQTKQMHTVPAENYTMQVPFEIYHGPIIYNKSGVMFGLGYAQTQLDLPDVVENKLSKFFKQESTLPILNLGVFVNYANKSHFKLKIPQFKLLAKEGANQVDWLGFNGDFSVSNDRSVIEGDMTLEGMHFIKDKIAATLGRLNNQFNLHKTKFGIYLGQADVSLPSLVVSDNDKRVFELAQFKVSSDSQVHDGLVSSHLQVSLDKVVSMGKVYGPANIKVSVNNLDAEVLAHINAQADKLQQGSDSDKKQAMFAILPELPKLVGRGASFEISSLNLTMPEGKLAAGLKLSLSEGSVSNVFGLMKKIQGEGQIQMPSILVKQMLEESFKVKLMQQSALQRAMVTQMQNNAASANSQTEQPVTSKPINSDVSSSAPVDNVMTDQAVAAKAVEEAKNKLSGLVSQKLLVEKGSDYLIEFKFNQGQLMINGQPFNPAMLTL